MIRLYFILLSLSFLVFSCNQELTNESVGDTSTNESDLDKEPLVQTLPLDRCIHLYSQSLGNKLTAKKFCSCFMSQASQGLKEATILNFIEDRLDQVNDKELLLLTELYEACFARGITSDSAKFAGYSPEIVGIITETIKQNLKQVNLQETYNLELLTNCLVEAIQQNYTVGEVVSTNIMDTPAFQSLQERCAEEAKL